ncbi:hypothetical protein YN1_5310 [Nanoarchaeota archaeon]
MNYKDIIKIREFLIKNNLYKMYFYLMYWGLNSNSIFEYLDYLTKENNLEKIKEIGEKLERLYEGEKLFIKLVRLGKSSKGNKYSNEIKKLNQKYDYYINLLLSYLLQDKEKEYEELYNKFKDLLKKYEELINKILYELYSESKDKSYYL